MRCRRAGGADPGNVAALSLWLLAVAVATLSLQLLAAMLLWPLTTSCVVQGLIQREKAFLLQQNDEREASEAQQNQLRDQIEAALRQAREREQEGSQAAALRLVANNLRESLKRQQAGSLRGRLQRWKNQKDKYWQRVAVRVVAVQTAAARRAEIQSKLWAWQCGMQTEMISTMPASPKTVVGDSFYQPALHQLSPEQLEIITQREPTPQPTPELTPEPVTEPLPVSEPLVSSDDEPTNLVESVLLPLDLLTPEAPCTSDDDESPLKVAPELNTDDGPAAVELMNTVLMSLDHIAPTTELGTTAADLMNSVMASLDEIAPEIDDLDDEESLSTLANPLLGSVLMHLDHITPKLTQIDNNEASLADPLSDVMSSLDHIAPETDDLDQHVNESDVVNPLLGSVLMHLDHIAPKLTQIDNSEASLADPLSDVMSSLDQIAPALPRAPSPSDRGSSWRSVHSKDTQHADSEFLDENLNESSEVLAGSRQSKSRPHSRPSSRLSTSADPTNNQPSAAGTLDSVVSLGQLPKEVTSAANPLTNMMMALDRITPAPLTNTSMFPIHIEGRHTPGSRQTPVVQAGAPAEQFKAKATTDSEKQNVISAMGLKAMQNITRTMPPGL